MCRLPYFDGRTSSERLKIFEPQHFSLWMYSSFLLKDGSIANSFEWWSKLKTVDLATAWAIRAISLSSWVFKIEEETAYFLCWSLQKLIRKNIKMLLRLSHGLKVRCLSFARAMCKWTLMLDQLLSCDAFKMWSDCELFSTIEVPEKKWSRSDIPLFMSTKDTRSV